MATTSVVRAEFINLLETVRPGLSTKDILEQSSCFVFANGWLITFNGEVACRTRTQLPEDFSGAVDAAPLLGVLYKIADDNVDLSVDGGMLKIGGVRKASGVRLQSEIVLPLEHVERPSGWATLPEDFSAAVEVVQETAGTGKDEFLTLCVHVAPGHMESCDRFQATRYEISCGNERPFLVRQAALKYVAGFGMHKMAETDNWVHFRNKNGLIFSCRRFADKYPDMGPMFAARGEPAVLPRGASTAAELAGIFSGEDADNDRVTVELSPGRMRVYGEGVHGWAREDLELGGYRGKPVKFRISPKLLALVVKNKKPECEIGVDKLRVDGERWTYITVLGPVEDKTETAPAKPRKRAGDAEPTPEPARRGRERDENDDPF